VINISILTELYKLHTACFELMYHSDIMYNSELGLLKVLNANFSVTLAPHHSIDKIVQ